jgi:hypothetical protein
MAFSVGINKQVFYKAETTWGTLAGTGSGKTLRRVTAAFNLMKETYESGEIRTDYQVADFRHGVRSAEGSLNGELSPGTYSDFFAAVLAKDFAAGVTSGAGQVMTTSGTGPTYTLTRASGSWLTDGFKVGDVIRQTVSAFNAADVNKNYLITDITSALALTFIVLNASTVTIGASAATCVVTVVGKKTFAPTTGHTDKSFTVEEFYADLPQSEVYTGMKVNTASIALPATGLVTCDFGFMGKDLAQTGSSQYFVSPSAQGTSGVFAAVNGVLLVNGVAVALLTGVNINVNRNMQGATVVGSNSLAEMFEGRIVVDGDFSAYFDGGTIRDLYNSETEVSLIAVITTSNVKDADFMSIVLPRIKVNSNTRDDGEQGIVAQHSFTALLNGAGGTGIKTEKTTISMQDSLA